MVKQNLIIDLQGKTMIQLREQVDSCSKEYVMLKNKADELGALLADVRAFMARVEEKNC